MKWTLDRIREIRSRVDEDDLIGAQKAMLGYALEDGVAHRHTLVDYGPPIDPETPVEIAPGVIVSYADAFQLSLDAWLCGAGYIVNGRRVDPREVTGASA